MPLTNPNAKNIRGMLLEEALLYLLKKSGYNTVDKAGNDPTLVQKGSSLLVKGRGGMHQIDAIADFVVNQPFCNPQRLLVEAKCYKKPVGIAVGRNAIGVLKDVSEYWVPSQNTGISTSRYHYTYALFSSSGYNKNTQKYAYAQDIYLIPLSNSAFIQSIINSIWELAESQLSIDVWWPEEKSISEVRTIIREMLREGFPENRIIRWGFREISNIQSFIRECNGIRYAILGLINNRFPIFLVPSSYIDVEDLSSDMIVRPRWDAESWYLYDREDRKIFSFDLPRELLDMYEQDGILTPKGALNLKQQTMGEIQAVVIINNSIKILQFRLDEKWFQTILRKEE